MKIRRKITVGLAVLVIMLSGALWTAGQANGATIQGHVSPLPPNPDVMVYLRPIGPTTGSADLFYTPNPYNSDGKGLGYYEFLNVANGLYIVTPLSPGYQFDKPARTVNVVNGAVAQIDNVTATTPFDVNFATVLTPVLPVCQYSYACSGTCQSDSTCTATATATNQPCTAGTPLTTTSCTYSGTPPPTTGGSYSNLVSGSDVRTTIAANGGESYFKFTITQAGANPYIQLISADMSTKQLMLIKKDDVNLVTRADYDAKWNNYITSGMDAGFGPVYWYTFDSGLTYSSVGQMISNAQAGTYSIIVVNRSAKTGTYRIQLYY